MNNLLPFNDRGLEDKLSYVTIIGKYLQFKIDLQ